MVMSLAACHPKDEAAITFTNSSGNTVKVRTATYLIFLYDATSEFKSKVDEAIAETTTTTTTTTTTAGTATVAATEAPTTTAVVYENQKVDGKDFDTWINNRAEEFAKTYAATELKFDEYKLSFTDEEEDGIAEYVDYYWNGNEQSNYETFAVANNISKDTFYDYVRNSYYKSSKVFEYVYGVDGPKEVSETDIKKALSENFAIANAITENFADSQTGETLTDEQKTKTKTLLDKYAGKIKSGMKFADAKTAYENEKNGVTQTTTAATTTAKAATTTAATTAGTTVAETTTQAPTGYDKKPLLEPKEDTSNLQIFGAEKTAEESPYYDKIKPMKTGDVSVLTFDDCYILAEKKDIMSDPYFLQQERMAAISFLKTEEYKDYLLSEGKKLEMKKNQGVVKAFTAEDITYPTAAAQ